MRKHTDSTPAGKTVQRAKPRLHPLAKLQRAVGNRAVTAYLQRDCAPPVAPPGITAEADPKFTAVTEDVAGKAKVAANHPTGEAEAKKAADAAEAPGDDREAQAKAAHTDTMGGAKPGGFDKAAFIAAVNQAIRAQRPQTNEDAKNFASSGKAQAVKSQVAGMVGDGKKQSAQDIADKTAQAPDTGVAVDKPITPLPPAAVPPTLDKPDPAKVIPDKAPEEQTNLDGGKCEVEGKMAEADVSEEQLAKSNEPEMTGAVTATKEMDAHATTAPDAMRAEESTQIATDKAGAGVAGAAGVAGLISERTTQTGHASLAQSEAKSKDEVERARIAGEIKTIFDATKSKVDGILGALDKTVGEEFSKGEEQARAAFERNHARWMDEYEDRIGLTQWVIDKFLPTKKEVLDIFVRAADQYEKDMAVVISNVANTIERELNKATDAIREGRDQVKAKVASQPAHLQKIAQQAAGDIGSKFDSLDSAVKDKQSALVEDLASRYAEARKGIDDRVKALQDEHKSLRDKAVDSVVGAIETIKQMKDLLLGVLARAAGAIELIIKDPIGFLGNLINAVKTGVMAFKDNIFEHLKKGLKTWLLGNLAAGGLEVPSTFDLKGILKMILGILGLTWPMIRQRLLKFIPEKAIKALEVGFEVVKILVTEGPAGLWKWVQQKIGDFKEMILSEIKQMVSIEIIKAGVIWLLSMLNPASAFVKACKAIVDIVMFFVNNAAQISELVNAVLDSVESIARGGVGQAAALVEKSLSRALPVVIGFLASMLGLGNIPGKIKGILAKIQEPIGKVIDSVVGTIAKAGKKLLGKLFKKKKKEDKKGTVKVTFSMNGASHSITVEPKKKPKMASVPGSIDGKLSKALASAKTQHQVIEEARRLLTKARKGTDRHNKLQCFVDCAEKKGKDGKSQEDRLKELGALSKQLDAAAKKGDEAAIKQVAQQVAGALESYANKFDLNDLGPYPPKKLKGIGEQHSYKKASSGRAAKGLEAEHIVPGKILEHMTRGIHGEKIYFKDENDPNASPYHQDITVLVPKMLADIKTDSGSGTLASDQAEIRRIKAVATRVEAQLEAGEAVDPKDAVDLNQVFLDRAMLTKQARDRVAAVIRAGSAQVPAGPAADAAADAFLRACSDGAIDGAVNKQLQNLWDLGKKAEGAKKPEDGGDCAC